MTKQETQEKTRIASRVTAELKAGAQEAAQVAQAFPEAIAFYMIAAGAQIAIDRCPDDRHPGELAGSALAPWIGIEDRAELIKALAKKRTFDARSERGIVKAVNNAIDRCAVAAVPLGVVAWYLMRIGAEIAQSAVSRGFAEAIIIHAAAPAMLCQK